jgi:hypothetical protein
MSDALVAQPDLLIGGQYAVDASRPLTGAAGGLVAFAAHGVGTRREGLMAVQVAPGAPPRAALLGLLAASPPPGMLTPLAHGTAPIAGGEAYFVICPAPPGPSLAATARSWSESELLEQVLRPAAAALDALATRHATHRAIRPDNLFCANPGEPVVLGCAWAAPPAMHQPVVFEPPYVGMCLPAGRGEGSIADDVYALGVTLLSLLLGRAPLAGLDTESILRRKLEFGSYTALTADTRLPTTFADLLRGMLAEDPAHRPPPTLLKDPAAARARRLAVQPPRRAQQALQIDGIGVWDARSAALAMASRPEEAARLLRLGVVDHWLRRGLGDSVLTERLDAAIGQRNGDLKPEDPRTEPMLAMRAVAVLDPLAPLCWRGLALWPDGLGSALAETQAGNNPAGAQERAARLEEMIAVEALGVWAGLHDDSEHASKLGQEARQYRAMQRGRSASNGMTRLIYTLNPLLPCASPLLAPHCVNRLADLLPALEAVAAKPEVRKLPPVDGHIAAFIAARQDGRDLADVVERSTSRSDSTTLTPLRTLAALQNRLPQRALPALAQWIGEQTAAEVTNWHSRSARTQIEAELRNLIAAGQLSAMLKLLDDQTGLGADRKKLTQAIGEIRRIDAELDHIAKSAMTRQTTARHFGHEVAAGAGLAALAVVLAFTALG